MTTDRIGQRLGNYTIMQLLGQGGFAEVYLGEHIYLKSQAAIKLLQTRLSGSDDTGSFLKEAQTLIKLSHPHIIRILDFGIDSETPYLVMDYAPKGTLRQKHLRGTPVPLSIIVPYVKQVADALQYAHDELRLIHRDIKPENMLVGRRDEILLSDFGIALVAQSSRHQGTQDVIGTVAYMAPEQIQGKPHAASDQYSLAVVVYEWLTGDRPFQGSFTEMCTQHIFATPALLTAKAPSLPPDIDLIVMQALAKDPRQRFENIQAFAAALEQVSLNRRGEQTEEMSATFHSLSTEAQTNNPAISRPVSWTPASATGASSQPMQSRAPGQPRTPATQPGQFHAPQPATNLQDTILPDSNEHGAPSFSPQSAYRPTQPAQPPQPKVVLPAPSAYPPQHSEGNKASSAPASYRPAEAYRPQQSQFPPRPDNVQQANQNQLPPSYTARPAQQQAMAPQHSVPDRPRYADYPNVSGNASAQPGFQAQPSPRQQEHVDESTNEGLGIVAPLVRPFFATLAGIILFCAASFLHPLILGRPLLLVLAVPLIFGVAFGPIVGLLVGLGGVVGFNQIQPFYILPPRIDYFFLREHLVSLHVIHYWWNPLLINGLIGFMAGLSMLRMKRYPKIGAVIRGTILGALGLLGSIGFVFYSQFGLSALLKSAVNIGILGGANVALALVLLILYSIMGRLVDPGA